MYITLATLFGYIGIEELIGELSKRDKREGSKMRKALIGISFAFPIVLAFLCLLFSPERILKVPDGILSKAISSPGPVLEKDSPVIALARSERANNIKMAWGG